MPMRTIVLKIYDPSSNKKKIMDEALLNYTKAFQFLLDKAKEDLKNIQQNYKDKLGRYNAKSVSKWIGSSLNGSLNNYSIEPFKDSIKIDFGAVISGYLNLISSGNNIEYPNVYIDKDKLNEEYEQLMKNYIDGQVSSEGVNKKTEKMIWKNSSLRPIFFCRYATNRNYCLLYDSIKKRYFLKIYLMNLKNENRKKIENRNNRLLRYVNKNGEVFKLHGQTEGFLLLPLAFGKYQEEYLKIGIKNPDIIKTARLQKRKNEYFISINMEMDGNEITATQRYLGISRGIENTINYVVVDHEDNIEKYGFVKAEDKEIQLNYLHAIANKMVKLAKKKKCQVLMEKLIDRGDRLNWKNKKGKQFTAILGCYDYNRLYDILKYKLPENGLPPPIRVSGTGVFYSCPRCAHTSTRNRFSEGVFICTNCGMSMSIEEVGGINVARKLIKYKNSLIKLKISEVPEGTKFINKELGLEYLVEKNQEQNDMLRKEITETVDVFYNNMNTEIHTESFKQKYSLIKKLESAEDVLKIINIV